MPIFDALQVHAPDSTDPVPWLESPLGLFTVPQLIQCRVCMHLKKANAKNFRNVETLDQFRTTCKPCEYKTVKGRSTAVRQRLIEQDPALPEAVKATLLNAVPGIVRASKKDLGDAKRAAYMRRSWDPVRMLVSRRRELLDARVRASAFTKGTLYHCMKEHPRTDEYVRRVLALYSTVISRLRRIDRWLDHTGWHYPPAHWVSRIGKDNDAIMYLDPWEFTTAGERAELTLYDPKGPNAGEEERHDWNQAVFQRGTIRYHVYPDLGPPDFMPVQCPAWLCRFNGYPMPEKPTIERDPDWVPQKRGPRKALHNLGAKDGYGFVWQHDVAPIEHDPDEWAKKMGLDK